MFTRRRWLTPFLVGGAALVIQVARLDANPAGDPFGAVFSEDGAVFLADAQHRGWRSFGYSFAGYGHLLPRLIGMVGSTVPLASYAVFAAVAATVVVAAAVALAYLPARRVVGPGWGLTGVLLIVLTPAVNWESLGVFANVQWFLMPAAAWFLLDDGRSSPWLTRGFVFVTVATAPLAVLLAPLLAAHGRRLLRHPATAALAAGALVQAAYVLLAPPSSPGPPRDAGLREGSARLFADLAVRRGGTGEASATALGVALVVVALVLVAGRLMWREHVLLLVVTLLVGVVPTLLTGYPTGRYVGVFLTFLLTTAVVTAQQRPHGVVPALAAVVLLASVYVGFPASANRVRGSSWEIHLRNALGVCLATGRAAIPVVPENFTPRAVVRC